MAIIHQQDSKSDDGDGSQEESGAMHKFSGALQVTEGPCSLWIALQRKFSTCTGAWQEFAPIEVAISFVRTVKHFHVDHQ